MAKGDRRASAERWPEGSFGRYIYLSGDFVKSVAMAIQRADPPNKERLRRAFPQMVAAFELGGDWTGVPEEYVPQYDAHRRRGEKGGS